MTNWTQLASFLHFVLTKNNTVICSKHAIETERCTNPLLEYKARSVVLIHKWNSNKSLQLEYSIYSSDWSGRSSVLKCGVGQLCRLWLLLTTRANLKWGWCNPHPCNPPLSRHTTSFFTLLLVQWQENEPLIEAQVSTVVGDSFTTAPVPPILPYSEILIFKPRHPEAPLWKPRGFNTISALTFYLLYSKFQYFKLYFVELNFFSGAKSLLFTGGSLVCCLATHAHWPFSYHTCVHVCVCLCYRCARNFTSGSLCFILVEGHDEWWTDIKGVHTADYRKHIKKKHQLLIWMEG